MNKHKILKKHVLRTITTAIKHILNNITNVKMDRTPNPNLGHHTIGPRSLLRTKYSEHRSWLHLSLYSDHPRTWLCICPMMRTKDTYLITANQLGEVRIK